MRGHFRRLPATASAQVLEAASVLPTWPLWLLVYLFVHALAENDSANEEKEEKVPADQAELQQEQDGVDVQKTDESDWGGVLLMEIEV